MAEAVLEARHLRKRFGATLAVADLSLQVSRGEVFGFLGPNGAGKTTSLKMLLGLVEPTAGTGSVLGRPLGDRAARARLGFLPEHFRFQEWLTGRELLELHGTLAGLGRAARRARAEELLERVDLRDAAERPLRGYSKGMLQRIGLAQALIGRPEVVFLDEPTSGLDPLGRRLVRDLIRELKAQGTTVFLNSHLLGEVEATCDRVAFVKQGRTIHELLLAGPRPAFEVELRIGAADPEVLEGLRRFGEPAAPLAADAGQPDTVNRLRLRVEDESRLPEIASWLVGHGVPLHALIPMRRTLEEWFLAIMGEDQRPG